MIIESNEGKNLLAGLGLLALTSVPLSLDLNAQNGYTARMGLACDIVKLNDFSHVSPGVESSVEKKLNGMKRLSGEFLIGFYPDIPGSKDYYSKMQANLGLKYHPLLENGWYVGAKVAFGISSEFYKTPNCPLNEYTNLTKSLALDVEKMFKKNKAINLSVSREIDRNIWIVSAKWVSKDNFLMRNRKKYPGF